MVGPVHVDAGGDGQREAGDSTVTFLLSQHRKVTGSMAEL